MDARLNGLSVVFEGVLDEHTQFAPLRTLLSETAQALKGARVRLDLSQVKRANSVGILGWFKLVQGLGLSATYVNVPVWLAEQFNFADGLRGDTFVESLLAPFYCPEDDTHAIVTLVVGTQVPLLDDYSDFEIRIPGEGGKVLEPDFEPEEYFAFLANYHDKFAKVLAG